MANLIIKSSADNLVLQGSDASPAITVGATGTTTFAESVTFASGKLFHGMTIFSSDGTWTKPAGVTAIYVIVTGAGGGGGGKGSTNDTGCGGAGGGTAIKWITSGLGSTETVTIGTGGAAGADSGDAGNGTTSSFGSHCSATGGAGGKHGNNNPGPTTPGVGSGGTINLKGGSGTGGGDNATAGIPTTNGGGSYWCPATMGGSYYGASVVGDKGAGGGGGFEQSPSTGDAASAGGAGYCVVYEYKG